MYFSHILRKYEKEVVIVKDNSQLVDGRLDETSSEYNIKLTILPITPKQIQEYEGGNYTTEDKKIIAREDLEADDGTSIELEENDVIKYNDEEYEIREDTPWSDYADFNSYVGKKKVVE